MLRRSTGFLTLLVVGGLLGALRVAADPADPVAPPTLLTPAQLDELVAPVALYPDVVLDAMLPASTAPADLAAAARVAASMGPSQIPTATPDPAWDPSVAALMQFPDVLRWMDENPAWVERLGFAVAVQQVDVLDAIQRYRAKAREAGVLDSNTYQTVTVTQAPTQIIVIQPVQPEIVYVPVYDPWAFNGGYVSGSPFYSSWFGFSFGIAGLWLRHQIFWGNGIYGYQDPYWYGRWRNPSNDWGTYRPTQWRAARRGDQHWTRAGWTPQSTTARPTSPRFRTTATGSGTAPTVTAPRIDPRRVGTAQSTTTTTDRTTVTPAAPVSRWNWGRDRKAPTDPPKTTSPKVAPETPTAKPTPTPKPKLVNPPAPRVVDPRTVDRWRGRGGRSMGGDEAKPAKPAEVPTVKPTPTPAAPKVTPAPAPSAKPATRWMPRNQNPPPKPPDAERSRKFKERGRKSLEST